MPSPDSKTAAFDKWRNTSDSVRLDTLLMSIPPALLVAKTEALAEVKLATEHSNQFRRKAAELEVRIVELLSHEDELKRLIEASPDRQLLAAGFVEGLLRNDKPSTDRPANDRYHELVSQTATGNPDIYVLAIFLQDAGIRDIDSKPGHRITRKDTLDVLNWVTEQLVAGVRPTLDTLTAFNMRMTYGRRA